MKADIKKIIRRKDGSYDIHLVNKGRIFPFYLPLVPTNDFEKGLHSRIEENPELIIDMEDYNDQINKEQLDKQKQIISKKIENMNKKLASIGVNYKITDADELVSAAKYIQSVEDMEKIESFKKKALKR